MLQEIDTAQLSAKSDLQDASRDNGKGNSTTLDTRVALRFGTAKEELTLLPKQIRLLERFVQWEKAWGARYMGQVFLVKTTISQNIIFKACFGGLER